MGNKDITEKLFEDHPDVFADIFNVLLFGGREEIDPSELQNANTHSIYKADGKIHEQDRDCAKYLIRNGVKVALLGLENQTVVDRTMPLRVMGYDSTSYNKMMLDRKEVAESNRKRTKNDKQPLPPFYPVVTLVLYYGDERWNDKHKSLHGLIDKGTVFEDYINDYPINLFQIQYLSDETVSMFKSDFRYVAELFTQYRKVREGELEKITLSPGDAKHAEELMNLLSVVIDDKDLLKACKRVLGKGEKLNMIPVFKEMKEEAREEGRIEGRIEGRKEGKEEGRIEGKIEERNTMSAQFKDVLRKDHPDWSEQKIQDEYDHFFSASAPEKS